MEKESQLKEGEEENKPPFGLPTLQAFARIIKEVGLLGFGAAFTATVFVFSASTEQRQEFVDRLILLKNQEGDYIPATIICVCLLLALILTNVYHVKRINYLKKENKRIGKEKSELQATQIGKKLKSAEKR